MNHTIEDPTRLLGQRVRDVATGFTGTATAVTINWSGAVQVCITGQFAPPSHFPELWVNRTRIEIIAVDEPGGVYA